MKWLLLLIVIWLVWHLLRTSRRASERSSPARPATLAMRACAHCGLNVPENELLHGVAGAAYCCAEHRRLGPARSRP